MEENNDNKKGIIKYDDYEKNISFPEDYDALIDEVLSLFHMSEDKKPYLVLSYKNTSGDSLKVCNQEEYSEFLTKMSQKEITNIISVSYKQLIKNKIIPYKEDVYDRDEDLEEDEDKDDEINLRKGHIFSNRQKYVSELFGEKVDINNILNESIERNINNENNINNDDNKDNFNNIFNNEIVKSVLPPVTSFPSYCNICQKFPIVKIMYYCNQCQLYLCEDCEKNLGYNHRHCYYKIRNKQQYHEIINMDNKKDDINKKIIIQKKQKQKTRMDNLREKNEGLNGMFNSILGFLTGSQNNNNNINNKKK